MRALPVERLVDGAGVYWSPATGTRTLPRRPSDQATDRDLRALPTLAGTTRDEGTLFTTTFYDRAGTPMTDVVFGTLRASAAGSRATEAALAYVPAGRSPGRTWSDVVTDRAYACPAAEFSAVHHCEIWGP